MVYSRFKRFTPIELVYSRLYFRVVLLLDWGAYIRLQSPKSNLQEAETPGLILELPSPRWVVFTTTEDPRLTLCICLKSHKDCTGQSGLLATNSLHLADYCLSHIYELSYMVDLVLTSAIYINKVAFLHNH